MKMFKIIIVTIILGLAENMVQAIAIYTKAHDLPNPWVDENAEDMSDEIYAFKNSNEDLESGSEVQQKNFEILQKGFEVQQKSLEVLQARLENLQFQQQTHSEKMLAKLELLNNATHKNAENCANPESAIERLHQQAQFDAIVRETNTQGQAFRELTNQMIIDSHKQIERSEFEQLLRKLDALTKRVTPLLSENIFYANCEDAVFEKRVSGVYFITLPTYGPEPFQVFCENRATGDVWTVIQRRQDGSENFLRGWTDYQKGFGNLTGEFWLGLDKLHALTAASPHELRIEVEDFAGVVKIARYNKFAIGGEDEDYKLNVLGEYSGDAGDGLRTSSFMKFSTIDRDNDVDADFHCVHWLKGAWWHKACGESNLNAQYFNEEIADEPEFRHVFWSNLRSKSAPLKRVQMALRTIRL